MDSKNNLRLRLRFYKDVDQSIIEIRDKFVNYKKNLSPDYLMKIRNNHIQFTITGDKQHYWSPYLTVELEEPMEEGKKGTHIRGLFGPAQTMWTFFIFLHFIVAGLFLTFSMFALSDYMLKKPMVTDLVLIFSMVVIWFLLYVVAREIREKGYDQMHELETVFDKIIES